MDERNFGNLGLTFQQSLLKTLIEDKKFAVTIIDVIDSKYFDGPYFKYLMENIKELYKLYGWIPNYDTLEQKIKKENKDVSAKVNLDTLAAIKDLVLEKDDYIKDVSLNFCRQQTLKKSLKEVEEIMNSGDFENYKTIEGIIQKALQVGASTDEIRDACSNVREALQADSRSPYPTGINGIDELLDGGLAKGELAIVLAPTGVGKSTALTKIANSGYNSGANVLQVFFEDNMNSILRKHYTIWTGFSSKEQPEHEDEVVTIVEDIGQRKNFIKLLKLPAFGVSVSDLKSKIRKLSSEGFDIDMLVLDYVDCLSSEKSVGGEEWKGEGDIMRSLEAMTDEFNICIWTATQGNRESISSDIVTTDQMGGSIKKAQIGHVVISVAKTLEQKEHNLATVTLLKSRIGKDGIVFQNCKFDNEYLEIDTDTQNTLLGHAEEKTEMKKQRAANVYQEAKNREKTKLEKDIDKLQEKKEKISHEIEEIKTDKSPNNVIEKIDIVDEVKVEISPPTIIEPTKSPPLTTSELSKARQRAIEIYKSSKKKMNSEELILTEN